MNEQWNEQWWKDNGRAVKSRLTKAEGNVRSQPAWAGAEARRVLALMDEHGYPDWWHRVQRLEMDARVNELYT